LLTLVGPAGAGKSRLAAEAISMLPNKLTPVWRFDLGRTFDPAQVRRFLIDDAGSRCRRLLFLDNVSTAVDDVGLFVTELMAAVPGTAVFVTSREPLRVSGERLIRIGPLPVWEFD